MKSLWKMIVGTVTVMLILCFFIEIFGAVLLLGSIALYLEDPQPVYIVTGLVGGAIAWFADVA